MLFSSRSKRVALIVTATGILSLTGIQAQTVGGSAFAGSGEAGDSGAFSGSATPTVTSTRAPQWHETVVPADKQISAKVTSGVLTVDGLVAKVHLNYDIHHASYMYFFVPGIGTAVVSRVQTYGSEKVPGALHGNMLAFNAGGHDFELTSQTALGAGKGNKSDVYVHLDTATVALDRMPMIGFGSTTHAPYAWPLSAAEGKDSQSHFVPPPPMPASILPRMIPSATTVTTAANDQALKPSL